MKIEIPFRAKVSTETTHDGVAIIEIEESENNTIDAVVRAIVESDTEPSVYALNELFEKYDSEIREYIKGEDND